MARPDFIAANLIVSGFLAFSIVPETSDRLGIWGLLAVVLFATHEIGAMGGAASRQATINELHGKLKAAQDAIAALEAARQEEQQRLF